MAWGTEREVPTLAGVCLTARETSVVQGSCLSGCQMMFPELDICILRGSPCSEQSADPMSGEVQRKADALAPPSGEMDTEVGLAWRLGGQDREKRSSGR